MQGDNMQGDNMQGVNMQGVNMKELLTLISELSERIDNLEKKVLVNDSVKVVDVDQKEVTNGNYDMYTSKIWDFGVHDSKGNGDNKEEEKEWKGGFGGMSNFNPLNQVVEVEEEKVIDYSVRPEKNKENMEGVTCVVYAYEQEYGVELDEEDTSELTEKLKVEDVEDVLNKLKGLCNGIKKLNVGRNEGLYSQILNILGYSIRVEYNKVSSGEYTGYNGLF